MQLVLSALALMTYLSACGGGGSSDGASSVNGSGGSSSAVAADSTSSAANVSASSSPSKATIASTTPLTITGTPPLSISVGSMYYYNANTTGGSGNTVTFSIQNRPSWATLNPATGELRGTPTTAGTYSNVIIGASDGQSYVTAKPFSIVVGGTGTSTTVAATITWAAPTNNTDGSSFDNPAGFVIHYGTTASALSQSVTIGSYNARSYTLTGLTKGQTYYFSVAAINTMNMEGDRSAVTSLLL